LAILKALLGSTAVAGYQKHLDATAKDYVRFLARAQPNGEFPGYREVELEAVAFVLMAVRSYLAVRYLGKHVKRRRTIVVGRARLAREHGRLAAIVSVRIVRRT
jgi:hypothetical protein